MIGSTISHYKISDMVGEGELGVVHKLVATNKESVC